MRKTAFTVFFMTMLAALAFADGADNVRAYRELAFASKQSSSEISSSQPAGLQTMSADVHKQTIDAWEVRSSKENDIRH